MCERLDELRDAVVAYGRAFEAELLSAADAEQVVQAAAVIVRVASTVNTLAAARVAARGSKGGAAPSAHDVRRLAGVTGTSVGAARQVLELGRRLAEQPRLAERARSGGLSADQAGLLADAGEADPAAVDTLVGQVQDGLSVGELRQQVAKVKAAACPDLEARRQEIHARRRLRTWVDPAGVWHIAGCGNPEAGAQLDAVLTPIVDELFRQARREGRREPPDAYRFDALKALAQQAASVDYCSRRAAPVKLLLRVDYDTFLRGAPIEGETCELVGYGPIAMSAVRDLLALGDPFVAAIMSKANDIVGVAHLGRQPTAHQRSALQWLYPACAAWGCPHQMHLEIDHRLDWAKTHYTMFDLLDGLCRHCHQLKTRDGWALVPGAGKRPFVPPEDPRHPNHHPPQRAPTTAA